MTNLNIFHTTSLATEQDELFVAYEAVSADIAAMPVEQLLPVTLDVLGAVGAVTGVLPRLRELRPQLAAELPQFDLAKFDKLQQYAQALSLLQGVYKSATTPKSDVAAQGADLTAIRDRLYSSAVALVDCGLLDGARLESCKKEIGYRAVAQDVFTLVAVFHDHADTAQGRTALDLTLLGKWRTQAFELIEAVGLRERAPANVGEVALERQKAFTLLVKTYDKARSAVSYLRADEGDAEAIAPSLYAGRGPSRRTSKEELTPPPTATSNASKEAAAPPPPIQIDNPHGLPLTSPFSA
jgi:hypothetical protein